MCENKSIWQNNTRIEKFPTLMEDKKTDVLIIGGGIAGVLTVYLLKKAGVDCVLVEKERICSGVTGNTTAKITLQHGLCYHKIVKSYGVEAAQMYYAANKEALETFKRLCEGKDCDFKLQDNFVYSVSDRKKLEREMTALENIGCPAELFEHLPLPISTAGGVCVRNQAEFHPLKFINAISKGLNIYENTFIKEMKGTTAIHDRGEISAKRVIVTTHFPFINKHGSYFLKLYQHRSYVLALKWTEKIKGMYVDDDKKGLSFRSYQDLLLLGGGGHRTGKKGGNYKELHDFAAVHYPKAYKVGQWAAQDCMSLDSIPYIGQYSAHTPNLFVATGFNKWGMTSSMVAARLLTDTLLDKKPDYAKVFSPSRSILKPQLLVNGLESTVNLLTPTSKRCPHLGCALKWNSVEHSWDCPCHGSRFSEDGRLLDNPANGDI